MEPEKPIEKKPIERKKGNEKKKLIKEHESLQTFVEKTKKLLARERQEEVDTLEAQLNSLSIKVRYGEWRFFSALRH
jgi:hypothetical protein